MDKNEKYILITVLVLLIAGAGFMYWGYTTVAHPKKLPECKNTTFHSISPQILTGKSFFHKFYNIEPYRGPFCIDKEEQYKTEQGEE